MNKFILDWDIFLIKTLKIQAVIQAIICVKLKAAALSCIMSVLWWLMKAPAGLLMRKILSSDYSQCVVANHVTLILYDTSWHRCAHCRNKKNTNDVTSHLSLKMLTSRQYSYCSMCWNLKQKIKEYRHRALLDSNHCIQTTMNMGTEQSLHYAEMSCSVNTF